MKPKHPTSAPKSPSAQTPPATAPQEIVSTLRCEVIKPYNAPGTPADAEVTWDALGRDLRALQTPLHRVLNYAITDMAVFDHQKGAFDRATKTIIPAALQTHAYRAVKAAWDAERARSAAIVEDPKKKNPLDGAIAETEPSGALVTGCAGLVYSLWSRYAKERWKGAMTLPTFGAGAPLLVASKGVRIDVVDGNFILTVTLVAGLRGSGQRRLIIRAYPGRQSDLKYIAAHPDALGDVKLKWDSKDKSWQAFLAYKRPAPQKRDGHVMAVHRGVRNWLTVAISGNAKDPQTRVLEAGADILAHKAQFKARRQALGRHKPSLGLAARGHGEARRQEHISRVASAEANWVRTRSQQAAARLTKLALQHGVGTILVEDWSNPASDAPAGDYGDYLVRSFPLAQLKTDILWAAKKAGIEIKIVSSAYNAADCPGCQQRHTPAPVKEGMFLCAQCGLKRPSDFVSVWNMLSRESEPAPIAVADKVAKDLADSLRAKARKTKPTARRR